MSTEYATVHPEPSVLASDEGHHLHFLNHLATIKVSGQSAGSLSVVEFVGPKDKIALGAEAHFVATGDTFQILSNEARFTCITASNTVVPSFDQMVAELGTTVDTPTMPKPGPIDPARVAEVNRAYGIEILGPPPSPLS